MSSKSMNTDTKKTLLPIKVPPAILSDIESDARHFFKTKDGIVQAALLLFFSFKRDERALHYKRIPNKIFGRPLKAS